MKRKRVSGDAPAASAVVLLVVASMAAPLRGQSSPENREILERLDRLERQNDELMQEVRQLRQELKAEHAANAPAEAPAATQAQAPVADELAVEQARIDEQAQSKVEAEHKLPLRITGMVLFNADVASHSDSGQGSGTVPLAPGKPAAGGTLNQSIIGLDYENPTSILGATVHGALFMDFWGSGPVYGAAGLGSAYQWPVPRLRTGTISLDWDSRSVTVGVDKPLIAPFQPDSFAQVAVPPLAGAGNLWLWEPQVRVEQRLHVSGADTLKLQAALFETHEGYGAPPGGYMPALEPVRPGWEGRIEYAHRSGDERLFSIAPGYHFSATHVAGQTVNSEVLSVDGQLRMERWWGLTGSFLTGQNLAVLGGSGPGFTLAPYYNTAQAVHSRAGWMQLTLAPTSRLSFHLYGGEQANKEADLQYNALSSNEVYAGNASYRIASNIFGSFEAWQTRTDWLYNGTRIRNQYDVALAYLF